MSHIAGVTITPLSPEITSAENAPTVTQGSEISYTATSTHPQGWPVWWAVLSDGGTGVTIDKVSGVMAGGSSASVGAHMISLVAAGEHSSGLDTLCLTWQVDAP